MKSLFATRKSAGGFALIALMSCLVVILIVFASVMSWISSNAQQMQKNVIYTDSQAAAEGASEIIFAHMDRDYLYGNLGPVSSYDTLTPLMTNWPVQYSYDENIALGSSVATLQPVGSQYGNLLGIPQTNIVTVTATPLGRRYNLPATVSQDFVFAVIPAFQFAIFYNINLEIDPGGTMPIQGSVFSNGSIWSGTANVTYSSTVEAAGQVYTGGTDPFASGKSDNGTPRGNFLYNGLPPQPQSNVNPLVIPIGASSGTNDTSTNVQAIVEIPPASVCAPQPVAYQQTNQVYDFNAASLIVSNWFWGTNGGTPWSNNFTVYLQDNVTAPSALSANWIQLTNDFFVYSNYYRGTPHLWTTNYVPNFRFSDNVSLMKWTNNPTGTNTVWYAGFSFLTNVAFYDYREHATVQAVQLDVGQLGNWIRDASPTGGSNWNQALCADTGQGIRSVYFDNTVPFQGQRQLPAVRVMDGQLLPYSTCTVEGETYFTCGLTVVTPQPIYVWGNYNVQTNGGPVVEGSHNTANTFPAAFMADAITVLSTNWQDNYNINTSINSRTPANTTLNAACLEGIVPSIGSSYSGGVENFLRLLENWSGKNLYYNGSIMVMFTSQYATNLWPSTGSVYNVPTRDWAFDTNFLIQSDLPPLTPDFRAVVRNSWSSY